MKRGVLAIFGSMNSETANTLITFTNAYHLPFLTWSYPIYTASMNDQQESHNYQLYTHPDISAVLIATIKYYKWNKVFYLYNHDDGNLILSLLELELYFLTIQALKTIGSLLSYQTESNDFTTELLVRKFTSIEDCDSLLK